jgi:hypothetical protein
MLTIAIDPGPEESAYVVLDASVPILFGKHPNAVVMSKLLLEAHLHDSLVIEQIASFGMPVGAEVFETVFWSGRFAQAWGREFHRIKRHEVKMHLCQNTRAKDGNIRQALIDRFGGKAATKKGGCLYGVSGDVWAALAVGVTFCDRNK